MGQRIYMKLYRSHHHREASHVCREYLPATTTAHPFESLTNKSVRNGDCGNQRQLLHFTKGNYVVPSGF